MNKTKDNLLDQQFEKNCDISYKLDDILSTLRRTDKYLCRSDAFKNFEISVRLLQEKLYEDYHRGACIIERREQSEEMKELQQALNRERQRRQELENKINEATTSSGLFIKYVKDKIRRLTNEQERNSM